jgi:hypothetical protein
LGLKENGLSPQEKLVRRREDIKPGFDAFKEWAETQHKSVLTKELLAEHYTIPSTNFPPLIPFLKMSGFNPIIMTRPKKSLQI